MKATKIFAIIMMALLMVATPSYDRSVKTVKQLKKPHGKLANNSSKIQLR